MKRTMMNNDGPYLLLRLIQQIVHSVQSPTRQVCHVKFGTDWFSSVQSPMLVSISITKNTTMIHRIKFLHHPMSRWQQLVAPFFILFFFSSSSSLLLFIFSSSSGHHLYPFLSIIFLFTFSKNNNNKSIIHYVVASSK